MLNPAQTLALIGLSLTSILGVYWDKCDEYGYLGPIRIRPDLLQKEIEEKRKKGLLKERESLTKSVWTNPDRRYTLYYRRDDYCPKLVD